MTNDNLRASLILWCAGPFALLVVCALIALWGSNRRIRSRVDRELAEIEATEAEAAASAAAWWAAGDDDDDDESAQITDMVMLDAGEVAQLQTLRMRWGVIPAEQH